METIHAHRLLADATETGRHCDYAASCGPLWHAMTWLLATLAGRPATTSQLLALARRWHQPEADVRAALERGFRDETLTYDSRTETWAVSRCRMWRAS